MEMMYSDWAYRVNEVHTDKSGVNDKDLNKKATVQR